MPDDERDRFGEKLRDVEKAREDLFFAERDRALLEKMKKQTGSEGEDSGPTLVKGRCPRCGEHLVATSRHDVAIHECPRDHGIWLDGGELEKMMTRENSGWLARILGRPR